ncbi:recombinase zinc beta ribbon domain-containing protein [Candidatus Uhrbacteria bacterium]|nr:recombinase zinc beta ribbon domain-containing protein [Candidatus Uhrbacteria bacterium]
MQSVQERRSVDSGEKGSRCFLLRGLLYCGLCQRRMTAELHPKGAYYRCYPDADGRHCPARYTPVLQFDAEVEQRLENISLPRETVVSLSAALDHLAEKQEARCTEERRSLGTKQSLLQNQLLQVTDGYVRGVVPAAAYAPLRDRYQAELNQVEACLRALDRDVHADVAAVKSLLQMAGALRRFYDLAPTEREKKDLLTRVFHRIVVVDRTVQSIEYQAPFDCLLSDDSRLRGSEIPPDAARELLEAGQSALAA